MKAREKHLKDVRRRRALEAREKSRLRMILVGLVLVLIAGAAAFPLSEWGKEERYQNRYGPLRTLYDRWHAHLIAGEWPQAYQLMTPRYRFYHSLEEFRQEFTPYAHPRYAVQQQHDIGRFGDEGGIIPNITVPPEKMLHLLMRRHQDQWQIKGRKHAEEKEIIATLLKMQEETDVESGQPADEPSGAP